MWLVWGWRPAAVALLLLVPVVACDEKPAVDDAPDPLTPALVATVIQYRPDEGTRRISIEVTNTSTTPVRVVAVQLDTDGFARVPSTAKDASFAPGQTIGLVTGYGDPRCAREGAIANAVAVLTLAGDSAAPRTVATPVSATGQAVLARLHRAECEQAALDDIAEVRLLPRLRGPEDGGTAVLRGVLLLRRPVSASGSRPLTVTSLQGSLLIELRPARAGHPVARLSGDEMSERVPVRLGSSGRCDAHALGGSTQTFLLSAFVRRASQPQQRVLLIPGPHSRRQLLRVVTLGCAGEAP